MAFVAVVLASIGLPGLAAFDARAAIVGLAVDGPFGAILLLGTFSPLVYYGRLAVVGLARPASGREGIVAGTRFSLTPLDLTAAREWLTTTWAANRAFSATVGALVLALVAVGTAIGGFGGPAAAAGLPPSLEVVAESFQPIDPNATPEPLPSGETAADGRARVVGRAGRDRTRRCAGIRGAVVRARPDGLSDGQSAGASTQRSTSRS